MMIKSLLLLISLLSVSLVQAETLTLNGFTKFSSVFKINGRVSGLVKAIPVKAGQRIAKGDLLIQLDDIPHAARLSRAKALESALLPAVQTAELELERAEELYDRDSLSQVELKNAQNALAEAEGKYQAAAAEKTLAEYQLKNAAITSPLDGRVLDIQTNVDQYIDPAVNDSALITLVNSQHMLATALINSEQWDSGLLNKKARVQFGDTTFNAKVSFLGFQRVKQSSGLPAYELYVSFKTSQLIPAEMPVTITIME